MPRGGTLKTGPAGLYTQHVFQMEDVKEVVRNKGPMSPGFLWGEGVHNSIGQALNF